MKDLGRRAFLKMLGLGGAALTSPKSLEMIATKLAGVKRAQPLLEVGHVVVPTQAGFILHEISIQITQALPVKYVLQFINGMQVKMFTRIEGKPTILMESQMAEALCVKFPYVFPEELACSPAEFVFKQIDPWAQMLPVSIVLHGLRIRQGKPTMAYAYWAQTRSARLDRDQAIEIGLANSMEPVDAKLEIAEF